VSGMSSVFLVWCPKCPLFSSICYGEHKCPFFCKSSVSAIHSGFLPFIHCVK
jgi:hypothetical protein